MKIDYKNLADQIIKEIGTDNIISVTHCQTRLRFVVKHKENINGKKIEAFNGVKGVFYGSGQYQVIIGTGDVNKVYEEIEKLKNVNTIYGQDDQEQGNHYSTENKSFVERLMAMFSGIFIPIVPVIAATGLFLGLTGAATNATVLKFFGTTPAAIPTSLNTIIGVLTSTVFAFLPALLVWSTFKYFKGTPIIGIVIGLMLVNPALPNAYSVASGTEHAIMLFGFIPVVGSQGSVLTALVAGYIGAKLELYFRKHIPKVVEQIFTPFLTMLVTFSIMILGVGPIVNWIQAGMIDGVKLVINLPLGIGGFLIGAAYPLMVLIGIHQTMIAIETALLATTGYNPLITLEAMYGFANIGVALAIVLRAKSKNIKEISIGAITSQLFGVSEPTLFGILIRWNFKPLIITVLTSGFGAALLSLFQIKANSYGLAVIPSYLMYIYNGHQLIVYTIVSILTVIIAFFATSAFAIPKEILISDPIQDSLGHIENLTIDDFKIYSPVKKGKVLPLTKTKDPVFASGIMGKGVAIISDGPEVYAPQDGEITIAADTGHAYGLVTNSGIEILIHIGIDTVSLKGEPFEVKVKVGQKVKKGDLLGTYNKKIIEKNGLDSSVIIIITNSEKFNSVETTENTNVSNGESILAIQK